MTIHASQRSAARAAVLAALGVLAWPASPALAEAPRAVPTFESIGLYWTPDVTPGGDDPACIVEFHAVPEPEWHTGLPLWYDARENQCRGSLVGLRPGTSYEIRVRSGDSDPQYVDAATWSEDLPIARTIELPEFSSDPVVIDDSGSASGYVLVAPAAGHAATIDVAHLADYDIVVHGHHVIVRGLTLKGGRRGGILLGNPPDEHHSDPQFADPDYVDPAHPDVSDIVIEGNDVSGWGTPAQIDPRYGTNLDAGVFSDSSKLTRLVIQRNRLHHPATDSNNWDEPNKAVGGHHPNGPQAIVLFNSLGNIVVRYNEISSDPEHRFNDGMGELRNFSNRGFPSRDSDIYGNLISHTWDDGIEAEGGDRNVRIWGNFLDQVYHPLGIAPVFGGPLYIWRNLSRVSVTNDDVGTGQSFLKNRNIGDEDGRDWGGGRVYLFNNTALRPVIGQGTTHFLVDIDASDNLRNLRTLNNVMQVWTPKSQYSIRDRFGIDNRFDYDLMPGLVQFSVPQEAHGLRASARLETGWGLDDRRKLGRFGLAAGSPGYDQGTIIPNFVEQYLGAALDMGAQETGGAALEFGPHAYEDHFEPVAGVDPNTTQTSNSARVPWPLGDVPIAVRGGTVSIGSGPFTSNAGTAHGGDLVRVRQVSAASASTLVATELDVDSRTLRFETTTAGTDASPDPIAFADAVDVPLASRRVSDLVTLGGLDAPVPVGVSNGDFSLNAAPYQKTAATARNGDTVQLRQTTAVGYSTIKTTTLTLGSTSSTFNTRTIDDDSLPDPLDFGRQIVVTLGATVTSRTVKVTGINHPVAISVDGGEYCVNALACTSAPGQVALNDNVKLRQVAASTYDVETTTTVTIGLGTGTFVSQTQLSDTSPDPFGYVSVPGVVPGTVVRSKSAEMAGFNTPVPISVQNGMYRINSGGYTASPGTVKATDNVYLRHTATAEYGADTVTTVTVGDVSATFTSTTLQQDVSPDPFAFADRLDVEPGTSVESAPAVISGITGAVPVSVVDGEWSIGSGPYTSDGGVVHAGDTVRVRHPSGSFGAAASTLLRVGDAQASFLSRTRAADADPDAFAFPAMQGVGRGITVTSASIVLSGFEIPLAIHVDGGAYCVNDAPCRSVDGMVSATDVLRLQHISAADFATTRETVVTIGTQSASFVSRTEEMDASPDPVVLGALSAVEPGTVYDSALVTVGGINTPVPVSVAGGLLSVDGGPFGANAGSVLAGDTLQVRVTSAPGFTTATSATLSLGDSGSTFTVTTRARDTDPDPFSFPPHPGAALKMDQVSDSVRITGFEGVLPISVSGGSYSLNGKKFVSQAGTIIPGDSVRIRHVSAAKPGVTVTSVLTIGATSATFTSTTAR